MTTTLYRGTAFVLADERGDVPPGGESGLYFDDVRCLSVLRLTLDGAPLVALGFDPAGDDACTVWLTNAKTEDLAADRIVVRRRILLDEGLREELVFASFADEPHALEARLDFEAEFADLYTVKKRALDAHTKAPPARAPRSRRRARAPCSRARCRTPSAARSSTSIRRRGSTASRPASRCASSAASAWS